MKKVYVITENCRDLGSTPLCVTLTEEEAIKEIDRLEKECYKEGIICNLSYCDIDLLKGK